MKSIRPIGEVQPAGAGGRTTPLEQPVKRLHADDLLERGAAAPLAGELSQTSPLSGAGILPKSGPSYYAPRPAESIEEIVARWAAECHSSAPARHHRDFGEWMTERLPLLVEALKANL